MNRTWLSKSKGNESKKSSAKRALPGLSACSDAPISSPSYNYKSLQNSSQCFKQEQEIKSKCQENPLLPIKSASSMSHLDVNFLPETPMPLSGKRKQTAASISNGECEKSKRYLLMPSVKVAATPKTVMERNPSSCMQLKLEGIPRWGCEQETPVLQDKEETNSRRSAYFMPAGKVRNFDPPPAIKQEPVIENCFSHATKCQPVLKLEWEDKPIAPHNSETSLERSIRSSPPSVKRSIGNQDRIMSVVSSRLLLPTQSRNNMFKQSPAVTNCLNRNESESCKSFTELFLKEFAGYEVKSVNPGVRSTLKQEPGPLKNETFEKFEIKREKSEQVVPSIARESLTKKSSDVSANIFYGQNLECPVFADLSPHRQHSKVCSSPSKQVSKAMQILEAEQPSVKLKSVLSPTSVQSNISKVMKPFLDNSFNDSEIDDDELEMDRETFLPDDEVGEQQVTDQFVQSTDLHDFLSMGFGRKWKEIEACRGLHGLPLYNVDMSLEALAVLASMKASSGRLSMTYLLSLYRGKLDSKHMKMAQSKHDDKLPFFRRGEPLSERDVKLFLQALVVRGLLSEKRELKKPFNKECVFFRILPKGEEYVNGPGRERIFIKMELSKAVKKKRSLRTATNTKGHNVSFKVDSKEIQTDYVMPHSDKVEQPCVSNRCLFPTDIPANSGGKPIFFGGTEEGE